MITQEITACAPYGTPEEMTQPWPQEKVQELHDVLTKVFNLNQPTPDTTLN